MASQQLAIEPDLHPRRLRMHIVSPGPRLPEGQECKVLPFGNKPASVFELPWPCAEEDKPRQIRPHVGHQCGFNGGHPWACVQPDRCSLPHKSPCEPCQEAVRASFRPGRYCSR